MKKYWLLIFVLVVLGRIYFSTLSYNNDMNNNLNWVDSIRNNGLENFYDRDFAPYSQANYPPLITSAFYASDLVAQKLYPDNRVARATFDKIPTIIVESFMIAFSLTFLSPLVFLTYLLNPGIFYNSVLWGQTEGLVAALVFLSLYLFFKKRPIYSSLAFTLSLLVKQSAVIFVPLVAFILWKIYGWKKFLIGICASIVLYAAWFIPIYGSSFFFKSFIFLSDTSQGQSPYASVNALNYWYLLGLNKIADSQGNFISYQVIGILLAVLFIIMAIYLFARRRSLDTALISAGLINFAVCMFMTRIHERHLLPTLVLIIPLAIKSRMNFFVYIAISLIYFMNLYLIWHEAFASYNINILKLLSFILIASFIYYLFEFFKLSKNAKS